MDSILNFPFYAINFLSDHLFKQQTKIIDNYLFHSPRILNTLEGT